MLFVTYTWDYVRSYWDLIERHAPAGAQPAPAAAPAPAQNVVRPHQPQQTIPQAEVPQETQTPEAPPNPSSSQVHAHVQAQAEVPQETQTPEAPPSLSSSDVQAQGKMPQETEAPKVFLGSSFSDLQGHIQAQDEIPHKDPASELSPSTAAQGHTQSHSADALEQPSSSSFLHEGPPALAPEAHAMALPSTQGYAQGHSAAGQPEYRGAASSSGVFQSAAAAAPQSGTSSSASHPDNDSTITGQPAPAAAAAQPVSYPEATLQASGSDFISEEMTPVVHDPGQAAMNAVQPSAAHEDPLLEPTSQTDWLAGPSSRPDAATQPDAAQPAGRLTHVAPEAPAPPARDADEITAHNADSPLDNGAATPMGTDANGPPAQGTDADGEAGPAAGHEGAAGQAAAAEAAQGMVIDAAGLDAPGAAPAQAAGAAAAGNAGPAPGEELQVRSWVQPDLHTLLSLLALYSWHCDALGMEYM